MANRYQEANDHVASGDAWIFDDATSSLQDLLTWVDDILADVENHVIVWDSGDSNARPSTPNAGRRWFNTAANLPQIYTGSRWLNNALASGTFTHSGGSSTTHTVTGVTDDQTERFEVLVNVDADPSFDADYAYGIDISKKWDDSDSEVDVDIEATWDTDPGSSNDVELAYMIVTA